jgi:hypothetical protein
MSQLIDDNLCNSNRFNLIAWKRHFIYDLQSPKFDDWHTEIATTAVGIEFNRTETNMMNVSSHNFDSCFTHTTIYTKHESIYLCLSLDSWAERTRRSLYMDVVIVTFVILISIQP